MKRIYIIDGILNIILGILSYIPFIFGTILIVGFGEVQTDFTAKISGVLVFLIWIILVLILNFILYKILNKYAKKINYVIRKKLFSLIAVVMILLAFLITSAFMAFM